MSDQQPTELDIVIRWADTNQLVTNGALSGRVIGYLSGGPGYTEVQVVLSGLTTSSVSPTAYLPFATLRELGLKPHGGGK